MHTEFRWFFSLHSLYVSLAPSCRIMHHACYSQNSFRIECLLNVNYFKCIYLCISAPFKNSPNSLIVYLKSVFVCVCVCISLDNF